MISSHWRAALALMLALACSPALANSDKDALGLTDKKETFGGFVAPPVLPDGANSFYGYIGVPEVGAGYRQGFKGFELEGRARLNYLLLSLAAEGLARYPIILPGRWELAPYLGLGLVGDTGATYLDDTNFGYFGLRFVGGLVTSYRVAETVRLLGTLDVPFDLPLTGRGGARGTPVVGGGAEIYLGNDITASAIGELGVDVVKPPSQNTFTRLGYAVRLGLGFRIF